MDVLTRSEIMEEIGKECRDAMEASRRAVGMIIANECKRLEGKPELIFLAARNAMAAYYDAMRFTPGY